MKKYSIINFVMLQSMMISGMDIQKNDMLRVKKMEAVRRIFKNRPPVENMERSTQSGEYMSLDRSESSSGSFSSLPIPIPKKSGDYSITGLVGSPTK